MGGRECDGWATESEPGREHVNMKSKFQETGPRRTDFDPDVHATFNTRNNPTNMLFKHKVLVFKLRFRREHKAPLTGRCCRFLVWVNTETSSPGMDDSYVNTIAAKDYRGPSQNIATAGEEGA